MKIAVLAANGKSGQAFVQIATEAGHSVRGGVRRRQGSFVHPNLEYVTCDATRTEDVTSLIRDCDAVVSLIGHVRGSSATVQSDAMHVMIAAMHAEGVNRIVSLTGTGVRKAEDRVTLIDRVMNFAIGVIDPRRISDGKMHATILRQSDLDWTILRVLKLTNGQVDSFRLTDHGPTKTFVGRGEVAEALLQIVEQHSYSKSMPMISKLT